MKLMHKLVAITASVLLAALSVISTANTAAASGTYYFGFEDRDSLAPFLAVANGIARKPGVSLERVTGENGCAYLRGDAYAKLKLSPIVWIAGTKAPPTNEAAAFPRPSPMLTWLLGYVPAEGANQITLDFAARSIDRTDRALPLAYIGAEPPKDAKQFAPMRAELTNRWQQFHLATIAATSNKVYFAIGWAGGYGSIGIDCINLNVQSVTDPPPVTVVSTTAPEAPSYLVGHVTWQGRPGQPDPQNEAPVALTLSSGALVANYLAKTDASGFFTMTVDTLPAGVYDWWAKGPRSLANAGTVTLTGDPEIQLELGLMKTGDANNDNAVTGLDFGITKATYGLAVGDPGYDDRADFSGDGCVGALDFALLRNNFGMGGALPISSASDPGN